MEQYQCCHLFTKYTTLLLTVLNFLFLVNDALTVAILKIQFTIICIKYGWIFNTVLISNTVRVPLS